MSKTEWLAFVTVMVSVASVAVYVGKLSERVNALDLDADSKAAVAAIKSARDRAVRAMHVQFRNPDNHMTPFTWSQDQEPVQMLRADEGICFLSAVAGAFNGDREAVSVEIIDGDWKLGGISGRPIAAEARCWRFPSPPAE